MVLGILSATCRPPERFHFNAVVDRPWRLETDVDADSSSSSQDNDIAALPNTDGDRIASSHPVLANQQLLFDQKSLKANFLDVPTFSIEELNQRLATYHECWSALHPPYRAKSDFSAGTDYVPMEQTSNGKAFLNYLKNRLQAGMLKCNGPNDCDMVYEVKIKGRAGNFLALCNVHRVNTVIGGPEHCTIMAGQLHAEIWIRAQIKERHCAMAPPPGTLVDGPSLFKLTGGATRQITNKVTDAIFKTLQSEPLRFSVSSEMQNENRKVIATATHRISPVLGRKWREQVSVRVDIFQSHSQISKDLIIKFSLFLWISQYNTDQKEFWHPPEERQELEYIAHIKKILSTQLKLICEQKTNPAEISRARVDLGDGIIECTSSLPKPKILPSNERSSKVSIITPPALILLAGKTVPAVKFQHSRHSSLTRRGCIGCHHNFADPAEGVTANSWRCRLCHNADYVIPMKQAAHTTCQECHTTIEPTACLGCHVPPPKSSVKSH